MLDIGTRLARMSEERLWKFRKPEWMNSSMARSAGVYGSGALVSFFIPVECVK